MTTLPPIAPKATMEEAWAEGDRLWAEVTRLRAEGDRLWEEGTRLWAEVTRLRTEGDRLWAEGERLRAEGDLLRAEGKLVVILTAQALYGKDVQIDWGKRTATPYAAQEAADAKA